MTHVEWYIHTCEGKRNNYWRDAEDEEAREAGKRKAEKNEEVTFKNWVLSKTISGRGPWIWEKLTS